MCKPSKQTILFLLIFFLPGCFGITAEAQLRPDEYHITFLTTEDGLSQATNYSVLQDRKGYMWLSSQDGINRYDGKSFFHFPDSFFYEGGPAPKQIYGLVEDAVGDIWMGSRTSLYRYREHKNVFQKINLPAIIRPSNKMLIPFASVGEEVWFMGDDLCLMAVHIRTLNTRVLYDLNEPQEVITPFILFPEVTSTGVIWMANGNRLYEINPAKKALNKYVLHAGHLTEGTPVTVKCLSLHRPSGMLALAADKGLLLFDTKTKKQHPLPENAEYIRSMETWYVKAGEDGFWISNASAQLIKLSVDGRRSEIVLEKNVLDNERYRANNTTCMYIDKWGRLWYNANGEYMAVIDFSRRFMRKIGVGKQGGFLSGTITSITVSDSVVWVSDNYLSKINRNTGKVEKIFSTADIGASGIFRQIYFDREQQRIWFNTNADLCYYSLGDGRCTKTSFPRSRNLSVDYMRNFVELPGQKLLMVRIDGVYEINRRDATARLLPGFDTSHIHHLARLSQQRLAFSVVGQPLRIYAYTDDLLVEERKRIDIPHTILMTMEDSAAHWLWVATEKGVYKLDNQTFSMLRHYTTADGMANDFVYAVIPDRYGWAWCSTNKGIVAINGATDEIRNFDKDPNLQSLEFNNRAFAADKDGYIYFGGVKGINYFKPPFVSGDTIQPRLVIEDISFNNKPYRTGINPDYLEEVELEYSPVPLSFKVMALHLVRAGSLKVVYRLKGQPQWTEIENGGNISMFNLAPGDYLLELSYREGNRVTATAQRQIRIRIHPPFYSTWWFILGLTILALLLVWLAVSRKQKRKLEKLQKENEIMKLRADRQLAVAKERERIIADLHDDIGATLSSMNIYSELASEVMTERPEEGKSLMHKISGISKELMGRMGDIIWSMKPADEEKYTLETRLKNYCSELLSPKNILFELDIDPQLAASVKQPEFRKNLLLIAREAVNNIAKYSRAGKVNISFKEENGAMQLLIRDDGRGFDPAAIPGGNGVSNIRQRCSLLGGDCTITSSPGKGVQVCCRFV